jgi:hypothetical protein
MGLLRRPTTGGIMEDGRFSRPRGPGAHSHAIQKTQVRGFAALPAFLPEEFTHEPAVVTYGPRLEESQPACCILKVAAKLVQGSQRVEAVDAASLTQLVDTSQIA